MFPEICKIGPITVYSYGFLLVIAFFLCSWLIMRQARKEGFNPELLFNLCFTVFIFGIIGARLFFISYNLKFYLQHPLEIIMLQHGGMSWFGGLFFGLISAVVFIKKNKLNFLKCADCIIPFIALAQSIGRIGCLLNGCCFGKISKIGIYFPVFDQNLIPTQLYSSFLLLMIFIILRYIQDKKHIPGTILAFYFFLYSIKRFFIEFLRNDSEKLIFDLTLFQILALSMFIVSLAMFFVIIKKTFETKWKS